MSGSVVIIIHNISKITVAHYTKLKAHQEDMYLQFDDNYHKGEYICTYDDGREILPDYVTHKFAKILAKSDLPKIRFCDLKHSAASLLINSGFNLKEVQEWLGHSNIATTVIILYGHTHQSSQYSINIRTVTSPRVTAHFYKSYILSFDIQILITAPVRTWRAPL